MWTQKQQIIGRILAVVPDKPKLSFGISSGVSFSQVSLSLTHLAYKMAIMVSCVDGEDSTFSSMEQFLA